METSASDNQELESTAIVAVNANGMMTTPAASSSTANGVDVNMTATDGDTNAYFEYDVTSSAYDPDTTTTTTSNAQLMPSNGQMATDSTGTTAVLFGQVLESSLSDKPVHESTAEHAEDVATDDKKTTGRPNHPAWEHFHRGEKRNRFHYHAYCKYCAANGVTPVAIRGVSGNMIRHLQKCAYCPPEIVTHLKVTCAQKDAMNFTKRHQSVPADVDLLLQDDPPPVTTRASKRLKRSDGSTATSQAPLQTTTVQATGGTMTTTTPLTTNTQRPNEEDFMMLQFPYELRNAPSTTRPTTTAVRSKPSASKATIPKSKSTIKKSSVKVPVAVATPSTAAVAKPTTMDHQVLKMLLARATLAGELPMDWITMDESVQWLKQLNPTLHLPSLQELYEPSLLASIGSSASKFQLNRMKDERHGVTLSINCWKAMYQKHYHVLFALVNASGEPAVHSMVEFEVEAFTTTNLSERIKTCLSSLDQDGIPIICITTDSIVVFAASRLALATSEAWQRIVVLPCLDHLLMLLLGVALTSSDVLMDTMGDVIELVQAFTNDRAQDVFRRECGDAEAALVLPQRTQWYSFIECIDSVRQYEDMIKIIATKSSMNGSHIGDLDTSVHKDRTPSLEELGLSHSVLQIIQNLEFWENVVSLSELMSPVKECYKRMHETPATTSFSLSDVMYQMGRMHQQYGVIMADWDESASGRRTIEQGRMLQDMVNNMWRFYDPHLAFVAYVLDYNLNDQYLAKNHASLQWLAAGKCAKDYYRRWFSAGRRDDTSSLFVEELVAYKEKKYPFDPDALCEFEHPRSLYQLISDSNPLLHLFGTRLFSMQMHTIAPLLCRLVPGKHFVPSSTAVVLPASVLTPLLQLRVSSASTSKESVGASWTTSRSSGTVSSGLDTSACTKNVWNKKQWKRMASDWKMHWQHEMNAHLDESMPLLDPMASSSRVGPVLTIDQMFKEKLPSRLPRDRDTVVDV